MYEERRNKTIFLREFSKSVVDKSQRRLNRTTLVVLDAISTGLSHSSGKEHRLYELIKEKSKEKVVELFYTLPRLK